MNLFSIRYLKERFRIERQAIRQLNFRNLFRGEFGELWGKASWQEVLPMQTPQNINISGVPFDTTADLLKFLDTKNLSYTTSEQSIYLPPATVDATPFSALRCSYPPNTGIKFFHNSEKLSANSDISDSDQGVNKQPKERSSHHILVANLLYQSGLGPRLYDQVELQCDNKKWTAYIVEHVDGPQITKSVCEDGLRRIRKLEQSNVLTTTLTGSSDRQESQAPDCNSSLMMNRQEKFQCVGFQDFALSNYTPYLKDIATRSISDSHFGHRSVLWGGKMLYQSVPGVPLPANRGSDERMVVIRQLMKDAGVTVRDKLVLDFGCNTGMMMAQYLLEGAKWCHGWDRANITTHTEELLYSLGCTRFSTTGGDIELSLDPKQTLPAFIHESLDGCVINYLAVWGHFGWLEALGRIPWSFMIFEAHQPFHRKNLNTQLEELDGMRKVVDFEVAKVGSYSDGISDERTVAILVRSTQAAPPMKN